MTTFDSVVFKFLNGIAGKYFLVDGVYIFFSEYLIYILTLVFGIYLFKVKDWRERVQLFSLGTLGVILSRVIITPVIRFFFYNPRPFVELDITTLINHADTGSLPSGHVAFIVPLMLTLWQINKRLGLWGLIGALLIGISRIGVGAHWPTDILLGFLVGAAGFATAWTFLRNRFYKKTEQEKEEELG